MTDYSVDYYSSNGSDGDRIALGWYAGLIKAAAPSGPVLDFGCGTGWLIHRLGRFTSADGIEPAVFPREASRKLNPKSMLYQDLDEAPKGFYGAISAIHVLEHIPDQQVPGTLNSLAGLLRQDGILFLVTPDAGGRAARITGGNWRALEDPTHINLRPHGYWRAQLIRAGFSMISEGTDGLWDPPYTNWMADRLRLMPIALQVMSRRMLLRPGGGESAVMIAAKADSTRD